MANPVLVEALRGGMVESRHRGAVAVFDADGTSVLEIGDIERPVFPRSAIKAIQALPLVESGAADAFALSDREIALACASHAGEPAHVELVGAILERAGLDAGALECGAHWPGGQEAMVALARAGSAPTPVHNNCSGKHAGFLCACRHAGFDHRGYVEADHPVQIMVREALEDVTGAAHESGECAVDGCSIPTCAVPLAALARGFARMASGVGLQPERARAARRIFRACTGEPFLVGGSGRHDTGIMEAGRGRVFVKTGAEGVFCGALPESGLGIALKCDDGAGRAAEIAIAAVLARLLSGDALGEEIGAFARRELTNWRGLGVGELRPTSALAPYAT